MKRTITACVALILCTTFLLDANAARKRRAAGGDSEEARLEYKATDMVNRGLELIEQKQEDRGLKLLKSVPENYPKSKTRFKAYLAVGNFYVSKRDYELALKQYMLCAEAENEELQAEGLYRAGICHFQLNNFDQAFVVLRKVTSDYPWSVYANEAYYYIGMCHFKLERWTRAAEALNMVGTSVPPNRKSEILAEAGQRIFVKIEDEDLVVLSEGEQSFTVEIAAGGGDKEALPMILFGKSGIRYLGSLPTALGDSVPGDGTLQFRGGDTVNITHVDRNTAEGERDVTLPATIRLVSTASAGFTDGAYREYTQGIFGGQPFFVRIRDLDADLTPQKDTLKARIHTQYTVKPEVDVNQRGIDLDAAEEEILQRDSLEITLTETEVHSGIFVGSAELRLADGEAAATGAASALLGAQDDEIVLNYSDALHIGGNQPRDVTYKVRVLTGDIQDVKIEHRLVKSLELKARKDLIESKIFLKLGQVFKDVGLNRQASEKAEEGLARTDSVIKAGLKAGLEREIVEQAFNVKWDLLMVQDKLSEAIGVCNTLIQMFPDSTLVDSALMRVAKAKLESGQEPERNAAISILSGILRLKQSDLKAEAQFMIAGIAEEGATVWARKGQAPNLSAALIEYKKCADNYPESPFAGDSLERIANYYLKAKDYGRAVELIEQVFQDYPDAGFLDEMLLKWAIASYRQGDLPLSMKKIQQVMREYPGSKAAGKAEKMLVILNKKLN